MKYSILITILLTLLNSNSFAKHGEHDGNENDDGSIIVCTDVTSNIKVLQFQSSQGGGQVSTTEYILNVKIRGDDIGEVFILNIKSGDSIKVKHLEELLKITLTTNEDQNPEILEVPTHRGFAEADLIHPTTFDSGHVKSISRRGINQMNVVLKTIENPNLSTNILCEKTK